MKEFIGICQLYGVLTKQEKVTVKCKKVVQELQDGYKFPYRIQISPDNDKLENYDIYPKKSKNVCRVLYVLGVNLENLPKEEKPNVKTVTYTVKLTKEQKALLEYLKSRL